MPPMSRSKHFGLAQIRGNEFRALQRFISINKLDFDPQEADDIIIAVQEQGQQRSLISWALDISLLRDYGIDPDTLIKK